MIYTVTFNPALDYVVFIKDLILDTVNRTSKEELYCGGKGINVSTVLKNLGIESVALGFVAGFTGVEIESRLKVLGVATDFIRLDQGMSRINIKIKSEKETEINGQGPNISAHALEQLYERIDQITDGDTLVLAGSIPKTLPDDIYEHMMKRVMHKDIKVVVDATKDLLLNVLKYRPFLIKPNNHELGEMFDKTLETDEEVSYYARELQKMGAENVLVSMAGNGAVLIDEGGIFHKIGVPNGIVKNSVGAGDSMVAGFIAGYLETSNYETALKVGTAAGSATAFSEGLADNELVKQLLKTL